MALFEISQKNKSEITYSDVNESDIMCTFLNDLKTLITFICDADKLNYKYQICRYFDVLNSNIDFLINIIPSGFQLISAFDYKDVPFNGYRSLFRIVNKCISHIYFNLKKISTSFLFKKKYEIQCEEYIRFFLQLVIILKQMFQLMGLQKNNKNLFLQKNEDKELYSSIMSSLEILQNEVFYGHCLGFYLSEQCQILAKLFCSIQLGMGQTLSQQESKSNFEFFLSAFVKSTKNLLREQKRGNQMFHLIKQSTITFCKQFWNLIDHPLVIRSYNLILPYLKVVKKIVLPGVPLFCQTLDKPSQNIQILSPATDNGYAEISIRLLSRVCREGMQGFCYKLFGEKLAKRSPYLLIHCHGGGFVAQSSQSHDGYLRHWAIDLDCPIVSIDYSLAPEFPFPRAHEECLYAYSWILQNLNNLGCLSNCKIVICGDSAGGNLVLGCVLELLKFHIRVPDGIFLSYPSTLLSLEPSPSRMIGTFCPILPIGILARCLLGYIGIDEENLIKSQNHHILSKSQNSSDDKLKPKSIAKKKFLEHETFNEVGARIFYSKSDTVFPITLAQKVNLSSNYLLSPLMADEELLKSLPPLSIVASEFDPLLDDSIELCKKVDKAGGKTVRLHVLKDLPHGFLNMGTPMSKDCIKGTKKCADEIRRLFQGY